MTIVEPENSRGPNCRLRAHKSILRINEKLEYQKHAAVKMKFNEDCKFFK